eukprot:GHVT01028101.1.p1 GENE.GHVT01028101.1~~GHVT01028101.1.p1  ORF type:complete len:223 (+),score=2.69 GHVT01028101.1:1766-2434(+)
MPMTATWRLVRIHNPQRLSANGNLRMEIFDGYHLGPAVVEKEAILEYEADLKHGIPLLDLHSCYVEVLPIDVCQLGLEMCDAAVRLAAVHLVGFQERFLNIPCSVPSIFSIPTVRELQHRVTVLRQPLPGSSPVNNLLDTSTKSDIEHYQTIRGCNRALQSHNNQTHPVHRDVVVVDDGNICSSCHSKDKCYVLTRQRQNVIDDRISTWDRLNSENPPAARH